MSKRNILIMVLVIIVVLSIYMLYNTFASYSTITNSNDTYIITLNEDNNTITIPSNSSKTIYYHIKNTNKGTVRYGVGYNSDSNISVMVYSDSMDKESGLIDYGGNKYIKLYLSNTSDSDSTLVLSTILGYENGGDLIVPDGIVLVSEEYIPPVEISTVSLAEYITNLYTKADKSTVVNNEITYNYVPSVSLMNDRLGGTTTSLDGGNIRYYGDNPNNYIYFNCDEYPDTNCELWRIIGVFDGKVKLMRNESIGAYSYDTSGSTTNSGRGKNEWSVAAIMKVLNPNYESESVGGSLYFNRGSGTCYNNTKYATGTCDFTSIGIKDNTKDMIKEESFNIGGYSNSKIYANDIYVYERSNNVISSPSDGVTRTTIWNGKIGLLYPSDYGYATDFTSCMDNLYNYKSDTCHSNDWMYNIMTSNGSNNAWLLTPYSSGAYGLWSISSLGGIYHYYNFAYEALGIIPVLYLNSDIMIDNNNIGNSEDPYLIIK